MSLKNFFRDVKIAGLRSNPKLCEVEYSYPYLLVKCGLQCVCYIEVRLDDPSKYDDAVKAAIQAVIKRHDQRMKADKRNRIGASDPRIGSDRPLQIRRTSRGFTWATISGRAQTGARLVT